MTSQPLGLAAAVAALEGARRRTLALTDLGEDDLTRQHSPLMSPLVWDLAHVGQQEEHWLLVRSGRVDATVFEPEIAALYDAFQHPRATRTRLPLLSPAESRTRIAAVRARTLDKLDRAPADQPHFVAGLLAQHEQQHVETMLATHQFRRGEPVLVAGSAAAGRVASCDAVLVPGGPFRCGADPLVEPWALDNEQPQHWVELPAFRIARFPVTNGEWLEFIAAGGYDEPRWWSRQGWAHRQDQGLVAPLFWSPDGARGWLRRRFGVAEEVPVGEPVQHVCWHEARAYARWAGARLPTELEWEKACGWDPVAGRRRRWPWGAEAPTASRCTLGGATLRPAAIGAHPSGASAHGVEQLIGDVWEWTSSAFAPWRGFQPMLYDTYSAPFFDGCYRVLRGGSWATDPVAVRPSFRNWDLPIRRQIFCGVRLAWDAAEADDDATPVAG